ncbi:MAG: hypothetical protein JSR54_18360 [Proteobacteria bacterium]|nr:hypothetical protein [Pseudomonadota bacterium]
MSRGLGSGWASAVVIGCITGIVLTADRLPLRVACHFGPGGLANGFMARAAYLQYTIGLLLIVPLLVASGILIAVRFFPQGLKVPDRDYWLAPQRREETAQYLLVHTTWLAALLAVLVFAIHLLVVEANRSVPARLDTGHFVGALAGFFIALVVWVGALRRRFRRE